MPLSINSSTCCLAIAKTRPAFQFWLPGNAWQTDQSVMAHRFKMVERFDVEARLADITAPSLILAGDRDLFSLTGESAHAGSRHFRAQVVQLRVVATLPL